VKKLIKKQRAFWKLLALLILLNINANNLFASGSATSGAILLRIPFDARNVALGGAGASYVGNINSLENNPAVAAFSDKAVISLSHIDVLSEAKMNSFIYSEPLSENIVISLYSKILKSDNIPKTQMIEIDCNRYLNQGTFNIQDYLVSLSFAHHTKKPLAILETNIMASYGLTLKYFKSQIAEYSANTFTGDVGIYFMKPYSSFSFGVALQNFGGKIKYISGSDKMPTTFRAGLTYNNIEYSKLIFTGDIIWLRAENLKAGIGIDYKISRSLTLRTGYDSRDDIGLGYTIGFGLNTNIFRKQDALLSIDYAYKPLEELGDYHYLTLTINY